MASPTFCPITANTSAGECEQICSKHDISMSHPNPTSNNNNLKVAIVGASTFYHDFRNVINRYLMHVLTNTIFNRIRNNIAIITQHDSAPGQAYDTFVICVLIALLVLILLLFSCSTYTYIPTPNSEFSQRFPSRHAVTYVKDDQLNPHVCEFDVILELVIANRCNVGDLYSWP